MDATAISQSPFAVVTFIAAPALLTNASSVLAMSTINRMLRTRDRMHELFAATEGGVAPGAGATRLVAQVNRVEKQAIILLSALRSIYLALGSFGGATLITLLGAILAHFQSALWFGLLAGLGFLLGTAGVGGLIHGSARLFQATKLSIINLKEEADSIREKARLAETHLQQQGVSPAQGVRPTQ